MSLVVWLPLNGNLENQGLSNVTVTNNGAIVDNNGKIGKCYAFNNNTSYISLTSTAINNCFKGGNNPFSIAFWILHADTSRAIIFGDYSLTGTINFNLELSVEHAVRFYWASNPDIFFTTALTGNIWQHVVVTYDGTKLRYYLNGELKDTQTYILAAKSKTNGEWRLGRDSRSGTTTLNGKLNDFRVYNHCLSAKEVKDLAKGLVLHYRLAGPGQENLITTMEAGGRTTLVDKYTLDADFGQNADTYGRINVNPALELDKIYTLSFDVLNMPVGSRWGFQLWNNNNYHFWIEGNGHYSYTFCPSASKLPNGYNLNKFLFDDSTRTNPAGIVTFTNFKIEEGSVATPWCPNPADTLYSAMGYNNNIEYDCSGYRRNGTKSGTITWDIDSPRYATSYKWPAATSAANRIISPGCTFDGKGITMAVWVKFTGTTAGGGNYHMPLESSTPGYYEMSVDTSGRLRAGIYVNGTRYVENCANPSMYDNKWHHIAITYNGSKICRYVDGKAYVETNVTGTANGLNQAFYIGSYGTNTTYYNNNIWESDARVYTTALSAEDIAELYHSAVIVDNTGKSYAYEYFEAQ